MHTLNAHSHGIIATPRFDKYVYICTGGNNCVLIIINFIQGRNCIKMKKTFFFFSVWLARNQKSLHFISVGSSSQKCCLPLGLCVILSGALEI